MRLYRRTSGTCVFLKITNAIRVNAQVEGFVVPVTFLGGQLYHRSRHPLYADSQLYGLYITNAKWRERKYYPLFRQEDAPYTIQGLVSAVPCPAANVGAPLRSPSGFAREVYVLNDAVPSPEWAH